MEKNGKSIFVLNEDLPIIAAALKGYTDKIETDIQRNKGAIGNIEMKYLRARSPNMSEEEWQNKLSEHAPEIRTLREQQKQLENKLRLTQFLLERVGKLQVKTRSFAT